MSRDARKGDVSVSDACGSVSWTEAVDTLMLDCGFQWIHRHGRRRVRQ